MGLNDIKIQADFIFLKSELQEIKSLVHNVRFIRFVHLCLYMLQNGGIVVYLQLKTYKQLKRYIMLTPVIQQLLEKRLGHDIRYPSDCERLAIDIANTTNQNIGVTTLKRLLGFIEDVKEPRLSTLDIIACYLGYRNYDVLLQQLTDVNNSSSFTKVEELSAKDLIVGQQVEFEYSPDRQIRVIYVGDSLFEVQESRNSKLERGDILEVYHFIINYPLLITNVARNGVNLGQYTAGKISGLTSISVI